MREKKFMGQSDVGQGILVTVAACKPHNTAKEDADPVMKWCLEFQESDKPLTLNSTNIQMCERIFGSDDTDHWTGRRPVCGPKRVLSRQGRGRHPHAGTEEGRTASVGTATAAAGRRTHGRRHPVLAHGYRGGHERTNAAREAPSVDDTQLHPRVAVLS